MKTFDIFLQYVYFTVVGPAPTEGRGNKAAVIVPILVILFVVVLIGVLVGAVLWRYVSMQ